MRVRDSVFGGVIMYLVAWLMHGLIFRWRATRLNADTVERLLAWPGKKLLGAVSTPRKLKPSSDDHP